MIRITKVSKVFNAGKANEFTAINDISLEVSAHKVTVIKGPSGSGKTTLLGIVGCMIRPTSGRVFLLEGSSRQGQPEMEITSLPERFLTEIRRRTFGFVFQQYNLIKGITALENVMLPAYPGGERAGLLRRRAMQLLELFEIADKARVEVEYLSGGESQRVTIARALINDPSIIIADEPTAHLDTRLSVEFMGFISRLKKEGKTAIIASHDPLVFESPDVDEIVTIRDGMISGLRS